MYTTGRRCRRSRSLYAPGLGILGESAVDIGAFLQSAAALEVEADKEGQSSNETGNQRPHLSRQDAIEIDTVQVGSTASPRLPHQSRSDPCFRINTVHPVQESSAETCNMNYNNDNDLEDDSPNQAGNLHQELDQDGRESSTDDSVFPDVNAYARSFSEGEAGALLGKDEIISVSSDGSFYISNSLGPSIACDKLSQQRKEVLSVLQKSMISNDSNSLNNLKQDIRRQRICDHFEHFPSSRTININDIQSLMESYLKQPKKESQAPRPTQQAGHDKKASHQNASRSEKEEAATDKDSYSMTSYTDSLEDPLIQRQLETSARCHDSTCHNRECVEMRRSMRNLKDPDVPIKCLSREEIVLLLNMHNHSSNCELSRCPLYWCDMNPKHLSRQDEILTVMKRRVENFAMDSFIGGAKRKEFIKLHAKYTGEGVDWTTLMLLGHSRNTILAWPKVQNQESSLKWVIKKVISPPEDDDSQIKLYQSLLDMKLPGIVQHFWAANYQDPNMFVVCTEFEALSLKEVIEDGPIQSLPLVVNLLLKLTGILEHLHHNGILFLNWSSSNILIDHTLTKVKLADFTAATLKERVKDEYIMAHLYEYLPVHLQPPELSGPYKVLDEPYKVLDEKSDVWGIGCLLHEIVTGKPVWHQYQHETLDGLREKMREKQRPVIPTDVKELTLIFKSCWELKRLARPVLDELNQLLINIQSPAPSTVVFQVSST